MGEPPAPAPGRAGRLAIDGRPRPHAEPLLHQLRGPREDFELACAQVGEMSGDQIDAPTTGAVQQSPSPGRGVDEDGAAVRGRRSSPHQPRSDEAVHDARHRCRPYALGGGELTERQRAAKHHDRQRREPRSAQTTRGVFVRCPPQDMDRGRVQAVGNLVDLTLHQIIR